MQSDSSSTANTSQVSGQNYQRTPPPKKPRKTYTYQKQWEVDPKYSKWVEESIRGDIYYYCKICNVDRKCATGGKYSLTKHAYSQDHIVRSGQRTNSQVNKVNESNVDNWSVQNNMLAQGSMNESSMNEVSCTPSTSGLQVAFERPSLPVTPQPTDIVQQPTITACGLSYIKQEPREDIEHSEEKDIRQELREGREHSEERECSSTHPGELIDVSLYCDVTLSSDSGTGPVTNISSKANCSTSSSNQREGFIKSGKIKMACFLAKHNLRLDISEDLKNLMQSVCSDSNIAKHLTLKETEAHLIISDIIGNVAQNALINTLIKEKFSLIVEDILDQSTKQLAFIARTAVDFKVENHFLSLISVEEPSCNTLHHEYSSIQEYFERNKIPYKENMIGLAAEATSAIFSTKVLSNTLLTKDIPDLFVLKCIRNSFHMCALHACKIFPVEFKLFVIRMNSYIQNKEFKRPQNVKQFQSCVNEKHDIHFGTDITSIPFLLPLVKELLKKFTDYTHQYAALYNTTPYQCSSPTTKLYLEFLRYILPCFDKVNMEMQSEVPKLYKLYKIVVKLYKEILDNFIKNIYLENDKVEEKQENELLSLDYESSDIQLPLQEIYLGGNVSLLLQNEYAKMDLNEITDFKKICKDFYIESITQIRKRLPFGNKEIKRLKSLTFLDPEHLIKKESVSSIADLGIYFEGICPRDMTELDREWRDLRNNKSLSNYDVTIKAEEFWKHVSEMKNDSLPMFPLLSQFVRSLLALPHSCAANQKIFSSINMLAASVQNRQTKTLHGFLHIQSLSNSSEPTEEHLNLFNNIFCKDHFTF